uniref:Uncharacterized protein n=1 Tax=viral metagenome TaxID=1070528 RepID=A0A6H1ZWZ3_9ZZZZ
MATINDLNISITSLSHEAQQLLIKQLRESRRIPKKKRVVVGRKATSKKSKDLILSLTKEQKEQLLKLLERK